MGKTVDNQWEFTKAVGMLISYADALGYQLTFGDAWAKKGEGRPHSKTSKHYDRLAVDFNLFIDGVYQISTEAHKPLGDYWEFLGGKWGGNFKRKDGNHFEWLR